tara:strand:+ start:296 stop:856 length:561 start_codon:yes stop_codon:yes gene_type:complete
MKRLILISALLFSFNGWAESIGLKCSSKTTSYQANYGILYYELNREAETVIQRRSMYFLKGKFGTSEAKSITYDITSEPQFYKWDNLDTSTFRGPWYDSNGNFSKQALNWITRQQYHSFKLDRESLTLTREHQPSFKRSNYECKVLSLLELDNELTEIINEEERIQNEEKLRKEEEEKEQLKRNKI